MLRPLRWLFAVIFLAGGAVLGALNAEPVTVDLGAIRFQVALGLVMLTTLLIGVLLGGLALTASVILPMRHRWRRERKALTAAAGSAGSNSASGSHHANVGASHGAHQNGFRSGATGEDDGLHH